jgi:hypothetical protein
LNQLGAHLPALTLPLLGLWPFAARWRRGEWANQRRPMWLLIVITLVGHTVVWSAWGSSRYFILCLLLLTPALLSKAEELWTNSVPKRRWRRAAAVVLPILSLIGLCIELGRTYARELSPVHGLPYMSDVRRAVRETGRLGVIAADRPSLLNLLREKPTVMLPYTLDPNGMHRFLDTYHPDALLLTIHPPLKEEAGRLAASWRSGALGPEWASAFDSGAAVLMIRTHPSRSPPRILNLEP